MTAWWVVVPVKDARRGKSRLAGALDDDARAALVRAMALDTLRAVLAARSVAGAVLVTPDAALAAAATALGVVVAGEPVAAAAAPAAAEPGLDAAVLTGCARARALAPDAPVAVVLGDLPRLVPADLDEALARAAAHDRAHVPDAEGTGTTVLTARPGHDPRPRFGPGSSARHARLGHVRLALPLASTLRHDVDDARDLGGVRAAG